MFALERLSSSAAPAPLQYTTLDNLLGAVRRKNEEVDEASKLAAAPESLLSGFGMVRRDYSGVGACAAWGLLLCFFFCLCLSLSLWCPCCSLLPQQGPEGMDLSFRPKMKEMEQWDLPTNLALPHLAENMQWSESLATEDAFGLSLMESIAPSLAGLQLPMLTDVGMDIARTPCA